MELEAIYHNGRLEFTSPVRFKKDRTEVRIVVSDEDIESDETHTREPQTEYSISRDVVEKSRDLRNRLDRIRNAPLPPDNQLPPLTEKHQERMDAFALRDEIRGDR